MTEQQLTYYFERYAQGKLSEEERVVFTGLLKDPANKEMVEQILDRDWPLWENNQLDFSQEIARIEQGVASRIHADTAVSEVRPVHRIRFLQKWGWAAAILILLGAGAYFYTTSKKTGKDFVKGKAISTPGILPGSNKALLTLSDGTTIPLDSAARGAIAQQGSASIVKTANDEIIYDARGLSQGEVMMNTMSTPRGGQYRLTLPDGTTVWLNAASAVTFPAAFTGNNRKVKVSGEVYMEVAKNAKMPFIVDVDGKAIVEVLGTSFNINSYTDEGAIATTLVEGRVKVLSANAAPSGGVTLRPGQQALQQHNIATITVNANANLEQVLAWKNGIFSFTGKSFSSVMKDVERWYDIQVRYEGAIPTRKLKGEMDRGVQLTDLIRFLRGFGLHVELKDRTLIIGEK
ncbi:FecR family protein [Chitinophaga ginsengisegetis]|uniref:FecR family protein n=1 Tax=Chitinophaga ginsengisegetis TaxID=393003 RepID=UPI000DBAC117|nr:FecR domain-containing protein [Chitinophaga ginsengisegetis]MDR6568256.1 ferric-dicitrate binding protein FerR (iron transport regulator) [Chitinophaga ginsengisegetis]MDR6648513.1 ferric-dicitrate binding protein FerR (iron transport regulator) [Chitinophaga ginsengisegetis]MDR6654337.1 ferric-dicitrate binding protein FerR (iron transport regulator) [Chitinophaga ginsengisegetis]